MGEKIIGNSAALCTQMLDDTVEVDGVPVDDRGGDEAQTRGTKALVLEGAVSDLALTMEEDGTAQRVAGLAFVEPGMAALPEVRIGQPLQSYVEYGWQEEKTNLPSPFPTISTRHEKRSRVA